MGLRKVIDDNLRYSNPRRQTEEYGAGDFPVHFPAEEAVPLRFMVITQTPEAGYGVCYGYVLKLNAAGEWERGDDLKSVTIPKAWR